MPPVDPSQVAGPLPQPFPGSGSGGALPGIPTTADPLKVRAQGNADTRVVLDQNQDARAAAELRMAQERAAIARGEADRKAKAASLTGGVDTNASGDTAAYLTIRLENAARQIAEINKRNPNAIQPGWGETIAGTFGNRARDLAIPQATRSDRQILNNSYSDAVDAALTLATGAAYTEEQHKAFTERYAPQVTDEPATILSKRRALQETIVAGAAKSGTSQILIDRAMAAINNLYPNTAGEYASASEAKGPASFSTTEHTLEIPQEYQDRNRAWLRDNPNGTAEDYLAMRRASDRQYFPDRELQPYDVEATRKWLKDTRSHPGNLVGDIPATNEKLGAWASGIARLAQSDAGAALNSATGALTLHLPDLFMSKQTREASQMSDELHPKSALAGEVLGSLAPAAALERVALAGITRGGEATIGQRIGSEMLGNAAYGGVDAMNRAEPEDRASSALWGTAIGGAAPLAARGIVKGARGFLGKEMQASLDAAGPETFTYGGREPLPVDHITPAHMQPLDDPALQMELDKARRGSQAWDAHANQSDLAAQADREAFHQAAAENTSRGQQLLEKTQKIAAENHLQQLAWVRSMRGINTTPAEMEQLFAEAEQRFPTHQQGIVAQNRELRELATPLQMPRPTVIQPPKLDPKDILEQRAQRLEQHLAQDPTVQTGTVPGIDLTTLQRAGAHGLEETFGGVPGIKGARQATIDQFGVKNAARALKRIGVEVPADAKSGPDLIASMKRSFGEAYTKLQPKIYGTTDGTFDSTMASLEAKAQQNPKLLPMWREAEAVVQGFRQPDGKFDGASYQKVNEKLNDLIEDWSDKNAVHSGPFKSDFRDAARLAEDLKDTITQQVIRANPAIGKQLMETNAGYAHFMRIARASYKAKLTGGVYAPDQYIQSIADMDHSVNNMGTITNSAPDMYWARQMQEAVGNKPKSTQRIFEAMLPLGGLGGAGYMAAGIPGVAATIGAGLTASYAPGVKRLTQALIDGKLGETPEAIIKALQGNKLGDTVLKGTSAEARQRLLEQIMRASLAPTPSNGN